eukprot:TRINITY_DN34058_c0_g1_i1.p1 TRINITY_DN34058_c0_g1~~TRINITY_DN34058_c0_g1_i1.p1  ORF type:complete len:735 (-),score=178.92 TRINITY_DN34058_c0_g1_i1:44-2248(-)
MDGRASAAFPGTLVSGVLSAGTGTVAAGSSQWDWQRELEVFAGRLSRGRAEEAAAARRAAEEAERTALRRTEEAERRALSQSSEEDAALQNFLCGWHAALEVRLEQITSQLNSMERRLDEDRRLSKDESAKMQEFASRLSGLDSEVKAIQPAMARYVEKEDLDALREESRSELRLQCSEVKADVLRREADGREALAGLGNRMGEVESRSEAAARGLSALEPFVEQVTSKLESLETTLCPALESLKSELSASAQIHRTAIAAEGNRAEEGLLALRGELVAQQEQLSTKDEELTQQVEKMRAVAEASKAESERVAQNFDELKLLTSSLDAKLSQGLRDSSFSAAEQQQQLQQEQQQQRQQLQQELQRQLAQMQSLLQEKIEASARDLRSSEERLESLLRRQLHEQEEAVRARLAAELEQLRASSTEGALKLQSVTESCQNLAAELDRVKGPGVSHDWRIPRCLQRLRYLSLSSEPGLWLDSERFDLGGVGPLEFRFYAKGLRGGDGLCAMALRLPAEAIACQAALPMLVDLSVGELTRRACQRQDPDGGVTWLVESLGTLEEHTGDDENADLCLRAQLPLLAAPALVATSSPLASADDLMAPTTSTAWKKASPAVSTTPSLSPMTSSGSLEAHVQPRGAPGRDPRGVPAAGTSRASPTRACPETPPHSSAAMGSAAPSSPDDAPPSGISALRGAWGSPAPLPVLGGKSTNPFDEQFAAGSATQLQRCPASVDDAAR